MPGRFASLVFRSLIATFLIAVAMGCESQDAASTPSGTSERSDDAPALEVPSVAPVPSPLLAHAPSEADWTDEHTRRVHESCGACHALPPADSLTRERWELVIPTMAVMPGPEGVPTPDDETLALAMAYYTRRAPKTLEPIPSYSPSRALQFRSESFTPRGLEKERIPAVANVAFVHLERPDRAELLISEMRTRALMIQIPWAPDPIRTQLRPLVPELNYPAHVAVADVNGDGLDDLVSAGLGGMNPSNDVRGGVYVSLQGEKRSFQRHPVSVSLARPCDAEPVDLDGDGDLDLVVAAFGWRGPGALHWFENVDPAATPPTYAARTLDERDGFIHVAPHDFDRDGDVDIAAVLSQEHEQIVLFRNDGGGQFAPLVVFAASHPSWGFSGMELVDLDRDGDSDLLVSNGDTLDDDLLKPYHGVRWFENTGGLEFIAHDIVALAGCESATAADLDGDGDTDVVAVAFLPQISPAVWKKHGLDSIIWAENIGGGQWRAHSLEKERCIHPTVTAADYDGDGDVDIAVGNYVWLPDSGEPKMRSDYVTLLTQE